MIFDWGSILNTNDTPSVTAFAVTAPPEGAPRAASPLAVLAPLNNNLSLQQAGEGENAGIDEKSRKIPYFI